MNNSVVKYLSKDYDSIKNNLVNFTKYYFSDQYKDFNESSVGMMFIKQMSYLGEILSFYTDTQLLETFQDYAKNQFNIINNAKMMAYKPKLGGSSQTILTISQLVPSTTYPWQPDWRYALNLTDVQAFSDEFGINFIAKESVNFAVSGSSATTVEIATQNENDEVELFLLKKQVPAYSGEIKTYEYSITDSTKYLSIEIPDDNVISILSVKDSDNNTWYEVPYLSQDLVFENVATELDPSLSQYKNNVPFLLKYRKVTKRFTTSVNENLRMYLQFGAGTNQTADELIIPNPGLNYDNFNKPIDPRAVLTTKTLGEVPNNTTLTIKYIKGYDVNANVPINSINALSSNNINATYNFTGEELNIFNQIKRSVQVTNEVAAVGSIGMESIDSIKLNSKANYAAQDRCVTISDYEARILSIPAIYGAVKKVKVIRDQNGYGLGAYCLTQDANGNLTQLNNAVKQNLINYLDFYRIASDTVNIRNAYIINIAVDFEIIAKNSVINKNEVLLACIEKLKKWFNIDNWQISQPIILSDIYNMLDDVPGVLTVKNINIINKYDATGVSYSNNFYDIKTASSITPGIIYTAVDPSIFEVKNLNTDIYGKII